MNATQKKLSKMLNSLLMNSGKTIATAESCTGGQVAAAIVVVAGASTYFKGGIVSYTNEVKEHLLGVSHQILNEYTAVSEPVARQMVEGACKSLKTDYAISVTGLAGPGGGTEEIPVGTIWIGYGAVDDIHTYRIEGDRGRANNLRNATTVALGLLVDYLQKKLLK